jgi:hypothetical protein
VAKDIRLWEVSPGEQLKELPTNKLDLEDRLERWLEDDITLVSEDLLVIGKQVETAYGIFIDLLCIDINGDTLVVELKKDKTPRDVVAQALDYGSWVKDLSNDDITEMAKDYLHTRKDLTFEDAFRQKFGEDLPEIINENHSMLVVAASLDSQTERIIEYLSDYYHVGINSLTFQYFKDEAGRELIGRVFLLDPAEVQQRAGTRPTAKRSHGTGPDWTRYDVSVSGVTKESLNKRRAMLFVAGELCNKGVSPEQIPQIISRNPHRVWRVVEGVFESGEFERLLGQKCDEKGERLDLGRWFYADDELIHIEDRTYALSKMWGDPNWTKAMQALQSAFPEYNITFDPVD